MVFKNMPFIRIGPLMFKFGGTHEGPANLVPFKTIGLYLFGEKGFIISFINLAGNIVLLAPIGFLVPFVYRNITWRKTIVLAVAAGLAIEGMEALLHVGIFDIDDVILNGLGFMAGYLAFIIAAKKIRWTRYKIIIITATALIAAAPGLYSFTFYRPHKPPVSSVRSADTIQPHRIDTGKVETAQLPDPCGGTGGTGQIVSVGKNTIIIKLHNGTNKTIKITKQTKIKNSAGPLPVPGLKTGDRVTVVIGLNGDDDSIASVILVCNAKNK
jgi:glycopeptide antibiotics resistance protein